MQYAVSTTHRECRDAHEQIDEDHIRRYVMKARLALPVAGSPAPRAVASATAPRLASVIGNRAARYATTGTNDAGRFSRPSVLCLQFEASNARAVGAPAVLTKLRGAASAPAPLPVLASSRPWPTLQMLFGGQRAALPTAAEDPPQVHAAAARGTATPATKLPFAGQIQRAFGRHDISGIQAHMGGDAAAAAREIGAQAYATGNHVVLGEGADLRAVAHEAAHVVQQQQGVKLKGGVGQVGDVYERHADAVAERVVAGEPVDDLLAAGPTGGGQNSAGNSHEGPVQRVLIDDTDITSGTKYADIVRALGYSNNFGFKKKPNKEQITELLQELEKRDDCENIVEALEELKEESDSDNGSESDESLSAREIEEESEAEDAESFRYDLFPKSVGDYKLVGVHETRSRNIGSLISGGISADKMNSGHGLGKGPGFYILPVMTGDKLRTATKDPKLRWGTRFVAVYIHKSCTLVKAADGENTVTLERKYEGKKCYYSFAELEHVIPVSLFDKVILAREPKDIMQI